MHRRLRPLPTSRLRPIPAGTSRAKPASTDPTRLVYVYVPYGMIRTKFTPRTASSDYEMPQMLTSLSDLRDKFSVLTGISNRWRPSPSKAPSQSRSSECWQSVWNLPLSARLRPIWPANRVSGETPAIVRRQGFTLVKRMLHHVAGGRAKRIQALRRRTATHGTSRAQCGCDV